MIKDSLTVIISNLQLLSEEKPDHPAINRYLELIDEARKINRAIDVLFSLRPGMK
ncbi:two-component sensor histidine kinase [Desulforamulus ruminis DSM 2154]|uniref:Two-component sensor histidine kinase n=2 Tax=Desulforamulus ruminis TaxID=1564 RepID=F6DLS8_DESRL|nr:two-component sensor histidine kinase [Desulforamulus ruminis DSM 2154]